MNYREALSRHVYFQKTIKPKIKEKYEVRLDLYNSKREAIKEATHRAEVYIPSQDLPQSEEDKYIKQIKDIVSNAKPSMTFEKNMLSLLSYVYKEDYENSLIAFHKFKESAYILIEDPDNHKRATGYDLKTSETTKYTGEGAYLMVCNDVKNRVKDMEELIRILGVNNGEVKQVLKSNKRMVKRHNKE